MNAILQPSAALASTGASLGVSDAEMAASVVIPRGELERLYRESQDRQAREARRIKRGGTLKNVTIAGLLGVVATQALAAVYLFPLVRVVPVIAVPQPDGSMAVVAHGDALPVEVRERAIRSTLFQYVRLREGWSTGEGQYAYDVVSRMSAPHVRTAFQEWFNLPVAPSPQAVYGPRATVSIEQINGTLLPHLRSVFDLSYTQTTLIESVWFIAYFFASIPSAKLIERVGYQRAMVFGLAMMAAGALMMVPAARLPSYGVTLFALFVIATFFT